MKVENINKSQERLMHSLLKGSILLLIDNINNQRQATWREFEPIGSTLLKNPRSVGWVGVKIT